MIHGDIKPANILLDSCGAAVIGDFGLSQEGHAGECMEVSRVYGTKPYLPQEFVRRNLLSTKVDVFSFGVVLFQLATGFKSYDAERNEKYPFLYDQMARTNENSKEVLDSIIDPTTPNDDACFMLCHLMINLGKMCTNINPHLRPEMISILKALENFYYKVTGKKY